MANVDKMYTYLRGYCIGANMTQSIIALQFAREHHRSATLLQRLGVYNLPILESGVVSNDVCNCK